MSYPQLRLLLLALTLTAAVAARAVPLSGEHPTLFRFAEDPQIFVFEPGNVGAAAFGKKDVSENPFNTQHEETQTQGRLLQLYAPGYAFSPATADAQSTAPAGYWERLRSAVGVSAQYGIATDCRATTELLAELRQHNVALQQFAAAFATSLQIPACLFSIDLPNPAADQLRDIMHASAPGLLIGKVCHSREQFADCAGFDFVVYYESALPPAYRGQAAVAFVRGKVGEIPIILASARPQFHKELFWIATGAAGIEYEHPLPPPDAPDHKTAWRNVRAISSMPHRFAGPPNLAPELMQRGIFGAVASRQVTAYLPLLNADLDLQLPEAAHVHPEYIGIWYNPVTDENILLPRVPWPHDGKIHLKTPSADPWIYLHVEMPASTDADATTTLILPEPPEPMDVDDDITSGT